MAKPVTTMLVMIAAALFIAALLRGGEVLTALAISTTNTSAATVNITAAVSTCGEAHCYDADATDDWIDLVGGDRRLVYCTAVCNDNNGWGNMINYTGTIGTSGASCTPADNRNCYQNATCENTSEVNVTAQSITCSYLFWFNADNTSQNGDWTGSIVAGEIGGSVSVPATDTIDVQELLALGVDAVLSFGAKSAAANDTTTSVDHNIYNYGNIQMDFQVNGSAMACGVGSIPAEYLKVNLTDNGYYEAGYPLSATLSGPDSGKFDAFNLDESTTASGTVVATSKATHWGIGIPPAVSGNCEGSIWFAAVES
ncbi:MAG: hypothetical protein QXD77_02505 [Candidatus Aenigmatarchaeota archaeon]